ncbi:uncharacterized protein CDAR_529761 [Caerostris darwini]|uniref:Uncharacterized protein n=1 Tax=Caerostris darwini TaxID=1538125 RepID=A0AAV4SDS3_9ARAC|nr:uncharacterized protein CDAR_529761 [Caerostris darwini]
MKLKTTIIIWTIIFLTTKQLVVCDSSFSRDRHELSQRRYREIGRFATSDKMDGHRLSGKIKIQLENSFTAEKDIAIASAEPDFDTDSNVPFRFIRTTSKTSRLSRDRFIENEKRTGRISNRQRVIRNSVAKSLSDEPIGFRRENSMYGRFLSLRQNRLSDKSRSNGLREQMSTKRTYILRDVRNIGRMATRNVRNTDILKMVRFTKMETTESVASSQSRAAISVSRQTRFFAPKRFSFEIRMKNTVGQETRRVDNYFRKNRQSVRNLPILKSAESSAERNVGSKLQQPRYERHLLVPKRELKIPSEERQVRLTNVRRSRNSIRTSAIDYGNKVITMSGRRNGKSLSTLPLRADANRYRFVRINDIRLQAKVSRYSTRRHQEQEGNVQISRPDRVQIKDVRDIRKFSRNNRDVSARRSTVSKQIPVRYDEKENQGVLIIRIVETGNTNRRQERQLSRYLGNLSSQNKHFLGSERREKHVTRISTEIINGERLSRKVRSTRSITKRHQGQENAQISGPDRVQVRDVRNIQKFSRNNRDISARRSTVSKQIPTRYETQGILNIRIVETRNTNRRQERQFSRYLSNLSSQSRSHLGSERKENHVARVSAPIVNDGRLSRQDARRTQERRIIQNRNLRMELMTKFGMRKTSQNEKKTEQKIAAVTRYDQRFSTRSVPQSSRTERSNLRSNERFHEIRNRYRTEEARNIRSRRTNVETRQPVMLLKARNIIHGRFIRSITKDNGISRDRRYISTKPGDVNLSELKESRLTRRIDGKERRYATNMNFDMNRKIISIRYGNSNENRLRTSQQSRRVQNEMRDFRRLGLNGKENRFEVRMKGSGSIRINRIRDELRQSNRRIYSRFSRQIPFQSTEKPQRQLRSRTSYENQQRISTRFVPNHSNVISKVFSSSNSTSKGNIRFSAKEPNEKSHGKFLTSTDHRENLRKLFTDSKSLSSKDVNWNLHEYISAYKLNSFISFVLNAMLGLSVVIVSADDKSKNFISRTMTPIVNGFSKFISAL